MASKLEEFNFSWVYCTMVNFSFWAVVDTQVFADLHMPLRDIPLKEQQQIPVKFRKVISGFPNTLSIPSTYSSLSQDR